MESIGLYGFFLKLNSDNRSGQMMLFTDIQVGPIKNKSAIFQQVEKKPLIVCRFLLAGLYNTRNHSTGHLQEDPGDGTELQSMCDHQV